MIYKLKQKLMTLLGFSSVIKLTNTRYFATDNFYYAKLLCWLFNGKIYRKTRSRHSRAFWEIRVKNKR